MPRKTSRFSNNLMLRTCFACVCVRMCVCVLVSCSTYFIKSKQANNNDNNNYYYYNNNNCENCQWGREEKPKQFSCFARVANCWQQFVKYIFIAIANTGTRTHTATHILKHNNNDKFRSQWGWQCDLAVSLPFDFGY